MHTQKCSNKNILLWYISKWKNNIEMVPVPWNEVWTIKERHIMFPKGHDPLKYSCLHISFNFMCMLWYQILTRLMMFKIIIHFKFLLFVTLHPNVIVVFENTLHIAYCQVQKYQFQYLSNLAICKRQVWYQTHIKSCTKKLPNKRNFPLSNFLYRQAPITLCSGNVKIQEIVPFTKKQDVFKSKWCCFQCNVT